MAGAERPSWGLAGGVQLVIFLFRFGVLDRGIRQRHISSLAEGFHGPGMSSGGRVQGYLIVPQKIPKNVGYTPASLDRPEL